MEKPLPIMVICCYERPYLLWINTPIPLDDKNKVLSFPPLHSPLAISTSEKKDEKITLLSKQCIPVCSQCSSIGSLGENWVKEMICSCNGGIVMSWRWSWPLGIPCEKPLASSLHVVYPTYKYVKNSTIGVEMAGSLILSDKCYHRKISFIIVLLNIMISWWWLYTFPKECLRKFEGNKNRPKTLAHSKYCMYSRTALVVSMLSTIKGESTITMGLCRKS